MCVCVCASVRVSVSKTCQIAKDSAKATLDARRATLDAVTPRPDGPKHSYSLGAPLKQGASMNCSANVSTITHWKGQQGRQADRAGRQAGSISLGAWKEVAERVVSKSVSQSVTQSVSQSVTLSVSHSVTEVQPFRAASRFCHDNAAYAQYAKRAGKVEVKVSTHTHTHTKQAINMNNNNDPLFCVPMLRPCRCLLLLLPAALPVSQGHGQENV